MSKKNEIQNKEANLPSTQMTDWGPANITAKDIIIPKILPLQYLSERVISKEGEYGEFRDTVNNEKFGDLETPFEIVPFLIQKKWLEFDMLPQKAGGFKREYSGSVPIQDNPALPGFNDDLLLSDLENKVERDRVMDVFVILPGDVEKGESFPYVLSFRRTSMKCGQKIATQMFVRNANAGKIPPATVMQMSGKSKENDDGTFVVQDAVALRPSTKEEMEQAFKWFKIINSGKAQVDESDVKAKAPVVEETEF